jgi:hypothetical protein
MFYLAHVSLHLTLLYVASIFNLAPTSLCFALPYPAYLTLGHAKRTKQNPSPPKNLNLSLSFVKAIAVALLLFDYIDTYMYIPHYLLALVELCKNLFPSQSFLLSSLSPRALSLTFN